MTSTILRFTNTIILAIIILLTITGLYGLVWPMPEWLFEIHRIASWAFVALVPWKVIIALNSLKRGFDKRFNRSVVIGVSLLLAALVSTVFVLGLLWTWRIGPAVVWLGVYGDAVISWHWMLALGLLIPFAIHVWRRWPKPKPVDFSGRRNALKLLALGTVGVVGWGIAETVARVRQLPEAPRRFTGSREEGSFAGLAYPVTHTVGQGQTVLDVDTWSLEVKGQNALRLTYSELLDRATSECTATLDCTSGWYSTHVWRGVWLKDILAEAQIDSTSAAIIMKDVSGYPAIFTASEANEVLLATEVDGVTLDHWHGFPVRAVAPSRRGWQWVKWLTTIEVVSAG